MKKTRNLWKIFNFPSHSKQNVLKILPFKLTGIENSCLIQFSQIEDKGDLK